MNMDVIHDFFFFVTNYDYIGFLQSLLENVTLEFFLYALVIYFFVIWIALIIWVSRDISNRTYNWLYQIISILLVIVWTPLWVFLYLMIRPGKTLFEQEYEEEYDDEQEYIKEEFLCFSCHKKIEEKFRFCPHCAIELQKKCWNCWDEIQANWKNCPYCWTFQEEQKEQEENISDETKKKKTTKSKKNYEKISEEITQEDELILSEENHTIFTTEEEHEQKK